MLVIPAIDILDGKCVRLFKGRYEEVVIYNDNPLDQAKKFEKLGVKRLHIVDLDGAKAGKPVNKDAIRSICSETNLVVEVGGGIRSLKTAKEYMELGVSKIIMSSALAKNPEIGAQAVKELGGEHFVAGIDFKDNRFAVAGWLETTDDTPLDFAKKLKDDGVSEFIFTDISRDGTLEGPNQEFYEEAVKLLGKGVIASGGIGSDSDLEALKTIAGIEGVVVGKAFYENKVDLSRWV